MIELREVWLKFGTCIYQDFFAIHSEFYDGILFALEGLSNSEKFELLNFVQSALRGNPSNQDLIDLWGKSGASDSLVSDQMSIIYEVILKAIEASIKDT
ncbi:hypothetical protein R50073_01110 [Maricurvus nonylphenolicus]|uniref:hypothetical protein n=1 Tax=Maricurvus nonylphenolicus TaxID=1008307 RepID=UPI0036F34615